MLLTIDIGNSSINMGFFIGEELIVHKMDVYPLKLPLEYAGIFRQVLKENNVEKTPEACIISTVVPGHTAALMEACRQVCKMEPLIVSSALSGRLKFGVSEPDKLGADRIAAAAAAIEIYGAPVAVVDFGTATTVNFIGLGNIFKGGAILPGVGLMRDCLYEHTAGLPEIPLRGPSSVLGTDTSGSMLSGIVYGTAGAVERIISETEEMEAETYKVVLTGGNCGLIAPYLRRFDFIEPHLVLKGLRSICRETSDA
ncbi:MAG: type III pantothenate kinase [Thermodesulfovibrionales bacterium]|nr:type III pantothenate kinase [Thermodesulfovibrionales bacterium]